MPPRTRERAVIVKRCGGSCVHSKEIGVAADDGSALTGLFPLALLLEGLQSLVDRLIDPEEGVQVRDLQDRRDAVAGMHQDEPAALRLEALEVPDENADGRRVEVIEVG